MPGIAAVQSGTDRGQVAATHFKPDDLARQLPALRVGEGANSGISPLAADGTVTLRSGSGLVELILEKSDQPVTFTIDTVLISKGKEFLR